MKIFNEEKNQELSNVDLTKGRLVADKLFIAHHEYIPPLYHSERYVNEEGYIDARVVVDRESRPAYDEYEDIQVYIPYTEEELQNLNSEYEIPEVEEEPPVEYKQLVIDKIRRRYDINDEIALINDKDLKRQEYAEYQAYRQICKNEAKAELGL